MFYDRFCLKTKLALLGISQVKSRPCFTPEKEINLKKLDDFINSVNLTLKVE